MLATIASAALAGIEAELVHVEVNTGEAGELKLPIDEQFADKGISGRKLRNATHGALGLFLSKIRSGEIVPGSVLIVENLNRLSRAEPLDAFDLLREIVKAGVEVVIRTKVPYFLRAQSKKGFRPARSHPAYHTTNVVFSDHETAMSALGKVVDALGEHWQATFLYGYVILYREHYLYKGVSAFLRKVGGQDWIRPEVHDEDAEPEEDDEDAAEA